MNPTIFLFLFSVLHAGFNPSPRVGNIYKDARVIADLTQINVWDVATNKTQWCVLKINPGASSGAVQNPGISMDAHGNIVRNSLPQKSFIYIAGNWKVLVSFGKKNPPQNSGTYRWRKEFRLFGSGRNFGTDDYFSPFVYGGDIISENPLRSAIGKISPAYMLPASWVGYFEDGVNMLEKAAPTKIDPDEKSYLFSSDNPIVNIAMWKQFGLPRSRSKITRQLSQGDMYRQATLFYLLMFNRHVPGDNLLTAAESVIKRSKKANDIEGIGLAIFTVQLNSSRLPDDKRNVCEKLASLIQQHLRTLEHDSSWEYLNKVLKQEERMGVELN